MQTTKQQNILFVTDLSLGSMAAAAAAAAKAKRCGARLILVHPLPMPEPELRTAEDVDPEMESPELPSPEHLAQEKLDELANLLHLEFNISVTRLIKPHLTQAEFLALANQLNALIEITPYPAAKEILPSPET